MNNKPKDTPCLLIMDAHSTHVTPKVIESAKNHQVELITIPAKTSHLLQPLDQIFHCMKEHFADLAISLKYVSSDILTNTSKLPYLLRIAMEKAWSTYVIKMAFQRKGICIYLMLLLLLTFDHKIISELMYLLVAEEKLTRGSLAKQSDCFCMAKTKRPKRKMVLAAYNRKKILPRYPVNLKLYRKKIGKFKMV